MSHLCRDCNKIIVVVRHPSTGLTFLNSEHSPLLNKKRPTWCHLLFLFRYLMLNMFRMLIHPSSGACDLFVELFRGLYCSGMMRVGVTLWFGWGGVLSGSKWHQVGLSLFIYQDDARSNKCKIHSPLSLEGEVKDCYMPDICTHKIVDDISVETSVFLLKLQFTFSQTLIWSLV